MWPLDLPARVVLKLPGDAVIPWAVFDPEWYLRSYPGAAPSAEPQAVLEYYLNIGQHQGHSPNQMFDETWHRLAYPRIADRVAAGQYTSCFDAYCRRGSLDRSPHWLFDELAYRDRYPDLTNDVFASIQISNGYDHYLRHGAGEGRIGHPLFDPDVYLSHFSGVEVEAIRRNGAFQHYLNRVDTGLPELRTSVYFDPDWYLRRYSAIALEIKAKRWKGALHHYLCNDHPTEFDPSESFSEAWYLDRDPGLRLAIDAGSFRNGYMHFLRFGARESRSPSASVDLAWYTAQASVRADLNAGRVPDIYTHWLTVGLGGGLASAAAATALLSAQQGRSLLDRSAAASLPIAGRFGYSFECLQEPAVSVVMVVRDGFATTMAAVASLRSSTAADIELILIDRGSDDETRYIGQYVQGATILRFERDLDWTQAADAGRQVAKAEYVLFLSHAAQIVPGSIDRARGRLAANASVGAIGGMLLQPHGVIAQAGGILWNDGGTHDFQRGESPLVPEANFVRDVDFCGLDFLLVRTALLSAVDGLDHECAADFAAVDLCVRIAHTGFRVVYDPSVIVVVAAPAVPISGGREYFRTKHQSVLATRSPPGGAVQIFARHAGRTPHRVLFIDDTVPLRRIGSGFVRANDLVKVMARLGYAVTVFPLNGCGHELAQVFHDMPDTVEVMYDLSLDRLAAFLRSRPLYYDTVWVTRIHNLAKVRPILTQIMAEGGLNARIVLDTEALTPRREAAQAALAGRTYDVQAAMGAILADAVICDQVVAVTEAEAAILHQHGFPATSVIGHMIDQKPTPRPFRQRAGMLFVGAIHAQDSPNLDGLTWFVDAVLPLIEATLRWETRLTIAGYIAPGIDLARLTNHPRITLRGAVTDLTPLYDASRIFVAPTRCAAGAPYKVLEAASRGLPVVATDLLREELGWVATQDILVAGTDDPAAFAAAVVNLYREENVWWSLRDNALHRLAQENGDGEFQQALMAVLAHDKLAESIDDNGKTASGS